MFFASSLIQLHCIFRIQEPWPWLFSALPISPPGLYVDIHMQIAQVQDCPASKPTQPAEAQKGPGRWTRIQSG